MKKVVVLVGILMVFALSSCNRKGCPNQLEAVHMEQLDQID